MALVATWWSRLPRPSVRVVRGLAIALLVSNIGIVVTGGAVRLTGSGLGCPTWPRCTDTSYVPHGELGIHGVLEFGNRLLTFVLAGIALLTWLAMLRLARRPRVATRLTFVIGAGIALQAPIGGLTVLTGLNPWVVNLHLMVSMGLIGLSVVVLRRLHEAEGPSRRTVPRPVRALAFGVLATTVAVVYLGTVVSGSGPHAGDADAPRNGLDPERWSQFHADLVFLLLGLTIGLWVAFRAVRAPARARRAAGVLLGIELAQGAIGFVQYFLGLPILIVGFHLLGSAVTMAAATWVVLGTRERAPRVEPARAATPEPEQLRPATAQSPATPESGLRSTVR